ncbi:MAG: translocation/assembly module TamB domain-containing protein [Saprospiraceae bacterium]
MIFSRFMRTSLGTFVFFILFILALIQSYWFQNWAIQKLTAFLGKELNTRVEIKHIGIDLLSNLTLDGLYIEDLRHDTLLYAEKLRVDYDLTWKALSGEGMTINGIMLENARINMIRKEGESDNNAQFLIDYFSSDKPRDPNVKSKPFDLKVKYLSFKKVDLRQVDRLSGMELYAFLDQGAIALDQMDLKDNCIQIRNIEFIQPSFVLKKGDAQPVSNEKLEPKNAANTEADKSAQTPMHLTLQRFRLSGGHFVFENMRRQAAPRKAAYLMDFNHLDINQINFDLDHLDVLGDEINATLAGISAREQCGFVLDNLSAQQFKMNPKRVELNGFNLRTPYSEIRDTFQLQFRDWSDFDDFNSKVRILAKLDNSHLAFKDLIPFDRQIAENPFIIKNQTEQFKIKGKISGKINRLSADSLFVETKGLSLQGNLNLNDVTDPDNVFIGFKVNRLVSDIATIKLFSGQKSLPQGVEKLGHINFNGFFYGFPYDFAAQGHLMTDLGRADMDIVYRPDPKLGKSVYNGGVDLTNFDLKEFTGNSNFGKVTLEANVNNGVGFEAKDAEADLSAKIKSLVFKGYTYENMTYKGKLDSKLVDGEFSIKDKNIDFSFQGAIDFRSFLPHYDFTADLNYIHLKSLNLSKEELDLAGNLEIVFDGNNLDNLHGYAKFNDISANFKGNKYFLDSLTVNSEISDSKNRLINFDSNILQGFIEGQFDFERLPKNLNNYLVNFHHNIAHRLNLELDPLVKGTDNIDFEVNIDNSANFTKLLHQDLDTLRGIHISGHYDNITNRLAMSTLLQYVHFQDIKLTDFGYNFNLESGKGDVDLQLYHTTIQDKYHINLITILGKMAGDSLQFDLNGDRVGSDLDSLNLNGLFSVRPNYYQVSFLQSRFSIFNEKWTVNEDNYFRIDKNFIETKNFEIQSGNRLISLTSIGRKGIDLNIKGFNFNLIDQILDDSRFSFGGDFEIDAKVEDLFELKGMSAVLNADTLIWNKRDWGKFRLDAQLDNLKSPVKASLAITKNDEQIMLEALYVLPGNAYMAKKRRYDGNYLDARLNTSNVPIEWISYLIGKGVSDMKGIVDAQMLVQGDLKNLELDGKARVRNTSFKIDYLNTSYLIKDEWATITTTKIDASGAKVYDETGNYATIEGGLTHKLFNKIRLNCALDSKEKSVLMLNTSKEQNNLYYGKGIGKVRVSFAGSFERTLINVERAVTSKGTQLNIPVSSDQEAEEVRFIKFRNKTAQSQATENQLVKTSGLDFRMTLTMTDEAECRIIFNEQTGDIIQGSGHGLLNIDVPAESDFTMDGDYTFNQGKYLFTIRQQFFSVDKPFTLRPGGTLKWNNSSPFEAEIALSADYTSPSISPYELIAPLLSTELEKQNARIPTQVEILMNMSGRLLRPEISFDIHLPQMIGQMKSFADTRINQLKLDASELNRQVFAIIVLGGFLPSGQQNFGATDVNNAINNTLSGIISNQFANYVNSWLRDVIKNNGIISGVDLNINTQAGINLSDLNPSFNSLQVRPRINLFDNRLSIDAGFITSEFNNQTSVTGDLAVEWYITRDRQLRFRVYNRNVQDVQGQRNRTGVGFSWRKDFDTWKELFARKKKISS